MSLLIVRGIDLYFRPIWYQWSPVKEEKTKQLKEIIEAYEFFTGGAIAKDLSNFLIYTLQLPAFRLKEKATLIELLLIEKQNQQLDYLNTKSQYWQLPLNYAYREPNSEIIKFIIEQWC